MAAFAKLLLLFLAFAFLGAPSSMADQVLHITPKVLERLNSLRPELNFEADEKTHYTGVPNPADRAAGDAAFSRLIDILVKELPKHSSKGFVLRQFELTLAKFSSADTEDRERATGYCEKIMDVLEIQSSDGVLNRWLYGPILGRLIKSKP